MWKRIRSKTSSVYTRVRLRASISLSRLSRTAAGEEFTSSAPVDLTSTFAQTGPRTPDESTDSRVETGQLGGNDLNHHVRTMGSGGNTKSNSSLLTHDSWGDDVATPSETYVQSYSNLITGTMPDSDRRTQLLATLGECRTPSDVIGALRLWEERMRLWRTGHQRRTVFGRRCWRPSGESMEERQQMDDEEACDRNSRESPAVYNPVNITMILSRRPSMI
jgi:hypothetical protein